MVSPILKALGAVVVGTPVAVALGLTARSIRKQEDAAVPMLREQESPLAVTVFGSYLDRRTHEPLPPTSFKRGYVAYDIRLENRTGRLVKGVHLELLDVGGDVVGSVRVGEVEAHGHEVVTAKRAWNAALEVARAHPDARPPRLVLTWRTSAGRRRSIVTPAVRRVLGPTPGLLRQQARQRPPVLAQVMS